MNTYFQQDGEFNSNKRIIDAYLAEQPVSTGAWRGRLEQLLFVLLSIVRVLTCAKARRICKALSLAVCLVAFVGVIGAMEHGTLSFGAGILIGLVIIAAEALCLRPHRSESR